MQKFLVFRNLLLIYRNYKLLRFAFAVLRNSKNSALTTRKFVSGLSDSELESLEFLDRMYLMLRNSVADNREAFKRVGAIRESFLRVYAEEIITEQEDK